MILRRASRLPSVLALTYGLLLVYASLQPFTDWAARPPDAPFFLFATRPHRLMWPDIWLNLLAYIPLGFFVALAGDGDRPRRAIATAAAVGVALSFGLETLQMWLPARVGSPVDFAANSAGTLLGAGLAVLYARTARLHARIAAWRDALFLGGRIGDVGLALLALWLIAHLNPVIPLFAATFHPLPADAADPADHLIEASEVGFNLVGVCLFLGLLLRHRRHLAAGSAILAGSALALKAIAAAAMLSPAGWKEWLSPAVTLGMVGGLIALLAAVWLPRPAQLVVCSIALLSALVSQLLAPDAMLARAPLSMFDWAYGQLLNFNGLTRGILLAWPPMVTIYLLALAGRPDWGRQGTRWL